MTVKVKFIGALRHVLGKTQLAVEYEEEMTVKKLLGKLGNSARQLEKSFCDPQSGDSASNALILVNGREISVLDGLETKLSDEDEVVFVPVVHGG